MKIEFENYFSQIIGEVSSSSVIGKRLLAMKKEELDPPFSNSFLKPCWVNDILGYRVDDGSSATFYFNVQGDLEDLIEEYMEEAAYPYSGIHPEDLFGRRCFFEENALDYLGDVLNFEALIIIKVVYEKGGE